MESKIAEEITSPEIAPQQATKKHIPALDGVRAIAIGVVFLYHYGGGKQSTSWLVRLFGNTINFGWVGVSLFFVLSGFLITGILWDSFREDGWWRRFYIRRSLRIFPLYYVALLIAAVVVLIAKVPPHPVPGLLVYVVYLQDFPSRFFNALTDPFSQSIWLGHLWSLAVEEQFYLIWPALLFLFARNRISAMRMILALWTLSFAYRIGVLYFSRSADWAMFTLMGRSGELLAGSYLALFVRGAANDQTRLRRICPYVLAITSAIFLCIATYIVREGLDATQNDRIMAGIGLALLSVLSPCALVVSIENRFLRGWLSVAPLRWIGKISYGLYVYHFLFRRQFYALASLVAPHASATKHLLLVAIIAFFGTFAIASVSYYTLELAFLKLKSRLSEAKG